MNMYEFLLDYYKMEGDIEKISGVIAPRSFDTNFLEDENTGVEAMVEVVYWAPVEDIWGNIIDFDLRMDYLTLDTVYTIMMYYK